MSIRCARGTKDVLPAEIPTWHFLEDVARDLAEDYGYREIRTPMFESPDLFLKGMGATAGLVERELWTFHDKHGRKLALRPDLTAPTVRACHDHGLLQPETGPTRLYYLGSVFMHGREREVESRQLHQFGLEALGSKDPALDAEVLVMVSDLCSALGLPDVQIQLNSLGCKKCRPAYHQLLKDYFGGRQEELCRTCKRRYRTHPLWTLGCQSEPCLELSRVAPSIFGTLCPDCRNHFSALKTYLKELKIEYRLNPLVVRDLEYYDRTIFQVTCAGRPVAFGGRYDELSSVLGGPATPAVGCSVDLEPLLEAMHEAGLDAPAPEPPRVCLAGDGEEAVSLLLPIVYALRRSGVRADLVYPMKAEETALQAAERVTAPLLVLLEEEDVRRRLVTLVEVDRGRRQQVRLEEAVSRIGRELGLEGLKDELRPVEIRRVSLGRRRRPVRSRALYGADVPRLSRTSSTRSEAEEEGEQGRRRRRRRSTRGEEAEVSRSASTPGAADETPKRSRKRRRSRSGSEAATGEGEAGRPTVVGGGEASSKQAVERSRRSRRRRKESEDSLEAAAAVPDVPESVPQEPGDESTIRDGSRRSGRSRRRRRSDSRSSGQVESGRPAAQDAADSSAAGERVEVPEPSGSTEGPVSADAAQDEDPTGARRRGRRRARRGGARTSEAVEAEVTPPEPLFAESLGGGAEAPPVLKRRRPSRRTSAGVGTSEASEVPSVSAPPPAEESRGSAADGEVVKPRARRRRTVKSADAEGASPTGEDA